MLLSSLATRDPELGFRTPTPLSEAPTALMSSLGEHLSTVNPPSLLACRNGCQASWCMSYLEGVPGNPSPGWGKQRSYIVLHQRSEVCSRRAENKQKKQGSQSSSCLVRGLLFLMLAVWYKDLKLTLKLSSPQFFPHLP